MPNKSRKYNKVNTSGNVTREVPFTEEHQVEYHEKFDTLWEQFGWQTPYVRNFIDGNKTIRIAVTALMTEEEMEDPTIDKAWEVEYKDGTHARLYTITQNGYEDHYVRRADPIDYFVEYINRAAQFGVWNDVEGHFCLMAGDTKDDGNRADFQLTYDMAALYNIETKSVDIYKVVITDDLKEDYLQDLEIDTDASDYDFNMYKEDCINRGYAEYELIESLDANQQKLKNLGLGTWLCKKAEIDEELTDGTKCLDNQWYDCYIVRYQNVIYALAGFKYDELISTSAFLGQNSLKKTMTTQQFADHMFVKWGLEDADGNGMTFGGTKIRETGDEFLLNYVPYTFKRHAYSGDIFYAMADANPLKGHPEEVYKFTCTMDPQYHIWTYTRELIEYSDAFMQWCGEGAYGTFDEDGKIYADGLLRADCDGNMYNIKPGPSTIYMVRKPMDPILYPEAEIIPAPMIQKVEFAWNGTGSNAEVNDIIDVIDFIDLDNKDKALAAGHAFWTYCNYERMYVPYTNNYVWYEENLTNSDDYLFRFDDQWFSIKNYVDDLYNESEHPLGSASSVHYDLTYDQVLDHVYTEWALGIRNEDDLVNRFGYDLEDYEFEKTFELDGQTYGKIKKSNGDIYIVEPHREESQIYSYTRYTEQEFIEYWLNHNCEYSTMKVYVEEVEELLEDILGERIVEISDGDLQTNQQIGWSTSAVTPYNLQGRLIAKLNYTPSGYKWVVENRIPTDDYRLAIKFRDAAEGALIDDIYKIDNAEPGVTLGIREDTHTYFKIEYDLDYDFLDAEVDEKVATEAYIIAKWLSENEVGETNDRFQRLKYKDSTYFTTDDNVGGYYCFEWDDENGILSHGYLYIVDSIDENNLDAVVTMQDCSADLKNDRVAKQIKAAIDDAELNVEFEINNKKNVITKVLPETEDLPERVIVISEDDIITYTYTMDNPNYPDLLTYDRSLVGIGVADYSDHMFCVWAENYNNLATKYVYDGVEYTYVSKTDGDRVISNPTATGVRFGNYVINTDATSGAKTYTYHGCTAEQVYMHELATQIKNGVTHTQLLNNYVIDGKYTIDPTCTWTIATKYEDGNFVGAKAYDSIYENDTTLLNVYARELDITEEDFFKHKFAIWLDNLSTALDANGKPKGLGQSCSVYNHVGIISTLIDTTGFKKHIVYNPEDEKYYRCTISYPSTEYPLYRVDMEDVTSLYTDEAFVTWLDSNEAFVGGLPYSLAGAYYGLEVVAKGMTTPMKMTEGTYIGHDVAYVTDGEKVYQIVYDADVEPKAVLSKKDVTDTLWADYQPYLTLRSYPQGITINDTLPRNNFNELSVYKDEYMNRVYPLGDGVGYMLGIEGSTVYVWNDSTNKICTVDLGNVVDGLTMINYTGTNYLTNYANYCIANMFTSSAGTISATQEAELMAYLNENVKALDNCTHVGVVTPSTDFGTNTITFYTVPSDWSSTTNRGHKWTMNNTSNWKTTVFDKKDETGPTMNGTLTSLGSKSSTYTRSDTSKGDITLTYAIPAGQVYVPALGSSSLSATGGTTSNNGGSIAAKNTIATKKSGTGNVTVAAYTAKVKAKDQEWSSMTGSTKVSNYKISNFFELSGGISGGAVSGTTSVSGTDVYYGAIGAPTITSTPTGYVEVNGVSMPYYTGTITVKIPNCYGASNKPWTQTLSYTKPAAPTTTNALDTDMATACGLSSTTVMQQVCTTPGEYYKKINGIDNWQAKFKRESGGSRYYIMPYSVPSSAVTIRAAKTVAGTWNSAVFGTASNIARTVTLNLKGYVGTL